jgi:MFS family permease
LQKVSGLPRSAWILFIGTFINKFGNFLAIFLVLYLTAEGYSPTVAGLALGVIGAGNFVGNLIGGSMADRLGRRGAIVVSMLGSGLCTLVIPLVDNIVLLLILVGAVGLFAQIYRPAAGAVLLDVVRDENRTTAFAVYRLSINLGMAAGPLVGGLLSSHSYNWMFVADALSSIAFAVVVLAMMPETSPKPTETGPGRETSRKLGYRVMVHDRSFVLFLLAIVATTYIYIQSTATLPLQVKDFGFPNSFYGLLLSLNAILVVAFELPLAHRLEHLHTRTLLIVGLALLGVGFGATAFADGWGTLVLTVVIWTLAEMVMMPSASAYPGRYAPALMRGRYQAAFGLAQTVATSIGPVVGGFLYSRSHQLNWLVCAVVAGVGILLCLGLRTAAPTAAGSDPAPSTAAGTDPAPSTAAGSVPSARGPAEPTATGQDGTRGDGAVDKTA